MKHKLGPTYTRFKGKKAKFEDFDWLKLRNLLKKDLHHEMKGHRSPRRSNKVEHTLFLCGRKLNI